MADEVYQVIPAGFPGVTLKKFMLHTISSWEMSSKCLLGSCVVQERQCGRLSRYMKANAAWRTIRDILAVWPGIPLLTEHSQSSVSPGFR